jgi:hypothetical protein
MGHLKPQKKPNATAAEISLTIVAKWKKTSFSKEKEALFEQMVPGRRKQRKHLKASEEWMTLTDCRDYVGKLNREPEIDDGGTSLVAV